MLDKHHSELGGSLSAVVVVAIVAVVLIERVALTCSQYCTVSLQFFAEKRLHILRNCSSVRARNFSWSKHSLAKTGTPVGWLVGFRS